ncbi:MAG: DUF4097 domain-containing protein [Oscillospiraceae bacterium]|nr:DUF4097 domain-containing protein [Oscillospiraceae bacterium]
MKVLAIILGSVFFVSLIGFIVTAAITGVSTEKGFGIGYYIGKGEPLNISETFEEEYEKIEIGVIASRVDVKISSDGKTRVNYRNNNPNVEFGWEIRDDTLVVREKWRGSFGFFSWGWDNNRQSSLDIEIPGGVYDAISIDTVSGSINARLPQTANLNANTVSGHVTLNSAGANSEVGKMNSLISSSTSGHITLNGFSPERFDISAVSGNVTATELSGSGKVSLTSGRANLDFSEWNGSLDVNLISGSAYINVPAGSGADLSFSRASGSLRYSMDGDEGKITTRSGTASVGGNNRQQVNVNLVSGKVEISTN